jgi:hypothetical protein
MAAEEDPLSNEYVGQPKAWLHTWQRKMSYALSAIEPLFFSCSACSLGHYTNGKRERTHQNENYEHKWTIKLYNY